MTPPAEATPPPPPIAATSFRRRILLALALLALIYSVHAIATLYIQRLQAHENISFELPFGKSVPIGIFPSWDWIYFYQNINQFRRYEWPPLYPLTLRGMLAVADAFHPAAPASRLGRAVGAALLLNLLSHFLIIFNLQDYFERGLLGPSKEHWTGRWAFATLLLFWFPGHNVFFSAYAESFYLALSLIALVQWNRGRVIGGSIWAAIASYVRNTGIFLSAGLLADRLRIAWRQLRSHKKPALLPLLAPLAAIAAYALWLYYVYYRTGMAPGQLVKPFLDDAVHAPGYNGEPLRSWLVHQLVYRDPQARIYFWLGIATLFYCLRRRLFAEAGYVASFYASVLVYTYAFIAWSRFLSVIYPWSFFLEAITRPITRLPLGRSIRYALLAVACVYSYHQQILLFGGRVGAP